MKVTFRPRMSSEHQDNDLRIPAALEALEKGGSCNEHAMARNTLMSPRAGDL